MALNPKLKQMQQRAVGSISQSVAAQRKALYAKLEAEREERRLAREKIATEYRTPGATRIKDLVLPGRPHGEGGEKPDEEIVDALDEGPLGAGVLNEDDEAKSDAAPAVAEPTVDLPPRPENLDPRASVIIPQEYRKMETVDVKALASKIDPSAVIRSRQDAFKVIEAEQARRIEGGV